MRKKFMIALAAVLLGLIAAGIAFGQTTTVAKAVQNPDGTYTIIEYPVGKEVAVTLNPISLPGATGTMTVLREWGNSSGSRVLMSCRSSSTYYAVT